MRSARSTCSLHRLSQETLRDGPTLSCCAPTGSIQEVSVSSGWGEEFLAVSERFDAVIKRV